MTDRNPTPSLPVRPLRVGAPRPNEPDFVPYADGPDDKDVDLNDADVLVAPRATGRASPRPLECYPTEQLIDELVARGWSHGRSRRGRKRRQLTEGS